MNISDETADAHDFRAPWGKTLKVISALSTMLLLGIPLVISLLLFDRAAVPPSARIAVGAVAPLIILPCLLFTIRGYSIVDNALLIHRLLWSTRIPLNDLRSVSVQPNAMRNSLSRAMAGSTPLPDCIATRSLGCSALLSRT
jgi:hypothetical protein